MLEGLCVTQSSAQLHFMYMFIILYQFFLQDVLQLNLMKLDPEVTINIAKSEQSSHTPGGSHHRWLRPYH